MILLSIIFLHRKKNHFENDILAKKRPWSWSLSILFLKDMHVFFQLDGVAETEITEDYLLKNRAKLKTVIPSDSSNLKPCRLHGLQGMYFLKYLRSKLEYWKAGFLMRFCCKTQQKCCVFDVFSAHVHSRRWELKNTTITSKF